MATVSDPRSKIVESEEELCRGSARLAAMVLLAEPERIADEAIGSFLLDVIPFLDRETGRRIASGWLSRAGVSPWRSCGELTRRESHLIAGQLVRYSKAKQQLQAAA